MTDLEIRLVRPGDEDALRHVAYATGYMGDSPAFYWRHEKSFADIWIGTYLDHFPETLWVAAEAGRPVGYLTGCLQTADAPSPAQAVRRHMLRSALPLRPGTAGFFWRAFADSLQGVPSGEIDDPRWPAHLHTNLLPEARGRGAGAALMRAWFAQLRDERVPGCHLGTLAENHDAIAFFERMGFERHGGPIFAPGLRSPDGGRHHLQLMTVDLEPADADQPPAGAPA